MVTMSKSAKHRVANDPNRLTYDYVANRLSDGREAVVVSEETKITNKIGDQVVNFTSRDVIELLVDNGDGTTTTLYTCRRGDFLNERPFPIISHITHHDRTYATGPRYTEDVIRTVLRTVKELRAAGVKDHNERAADRLNQLDIISANGKRWTAGMIHHITQA